MSIVVQDLVESGVYPSVDAAMNEALRVLWQERPAVRIDVAVYRYRAEGITLAKAATIAGVSFDRMKEILSERGVPLRLGPVTVAKARAELEALEMMRK